MKSLKQLKEERAMTYQQISDRSGVPVSTIHRVIGGQAKNPGYETVTAIRAALDEATDDAPDEPSPDDGCRSDSDLVASAPPFTTKSEPLYVFVDGVLGCIFRRDDTKKAGET